MKKYFCVLALLSIAVFAIPAHAAYYCSGTLTSVGIVSNDIVSIAGPDGLPNIYVCSLTSSSSGDGWDPNSCKAAYATLLAAKMSGQSVTMPFDDNLTCGTQPAYTQWAQTHAVYVQ